MSIQFRELSSKLPSTQGPLEGGSNLRDDVVRISLLTGAAIIFFVFSVLLISVVFFVFHSTLSQLQIALSALATALFCFAGARLYFPQKAGKTVLAVMLALLLFFFLFLYVSGNIYDLSFDGQSYQQEAVIGLKNGWNPVYESLPDVSMFYTKGPWIYEAALYRVTGNIEKSKVFNFLWIAASFLLALAALLRLKGIKSGSAVALAFLLACNPVSIYQSLTFYVDGQLASLLTIVLAVSYVLATRRDKFMLFVYFMVLVIGINLKLPFIGFAGVFGLGILLYLFIAGKRKRMTPLAATGLLAFIIGTLFVGFNPYVHNLMKHGNPFYPFVGPGAVDYMGSLDTPGNRPANFNSMNRFERLFHATFSESSNACLTVSSELKLPFTVKKSELDYPWIADIRVGGFGPLFGGAMIVTAVIFLGAFLRRPQGAGIFAGIAVAIAVSVLIHKDGWWARYAPQLYDLPLLAFILSLQMKGRAGKYAGYILMAIMAVNIVLVSSSYFRSTYVNSEAVKQQLAHLSSKAEPVYVYFGPFTPYRIRLENMGVKYIRVNSPPELPCSFPADLGPVRVCTDTGGIRG